MTKCSNNNYVFVYAPANSTLGPFCRQSYSRSLKMPREHCPGEACLKYGHYQYLPHCLEIQAECAHFMGDDKKSADLYRKCYYLCQVIEYQEGLEITKKEAKEYLGMEFET